jgi:cytochrome c biogenesis protein CcmG/thiol:disulfide interchange protein DsbE
VRIRALAATTALVVVGLLVVLALVEPPGDATGESPLLGAPAPAVESTTIDDADFSLERRKGSWVVFNFFNSTCVPCIAEHPALMAFAAREASRTDGAELYTIVNDDADDAVRDFFVRRGGDWPKVRDDDGTIAVAFGVARVPETWVIDPAGFVRLRVLGELGSGALEERLDELRAAWSS